MNNPTQPASIIHYNVCPSCGDSDISFQLSAKDYTVSQESFQIWECKHCTLRFTQDVPDQSAIGEYYKSENYISHTETKKGLINSLYHQVRKRTVSGKLSLIERYAGGSEKRLLDIGAGTGAFASFMNKNQWSVTAVEPDEDARSAANRVYGIKLQPSEELWFMTAAHFTVITMWHVLEHVHELHRYIKQIKNLLHQDGKAFIAVPNYTSYDAAHYKSHWAAYDVPRHLYHFSPSSMKALLATHGLRLAAMEPMWYDSFYVSMLSEQYKSGSGNYAAAFATGVISNMKAMAAKERCSSLIYIIDKKI